MSFVVSTPHGGLATILFLSGFTLQTLVSTPHGGLATGGLRYLEMIHEVSTPHGGLAT